MILKKKKPSDKAIFKKLIVGMKNFFSNKKIKILLMLLIGGLLIFSGIFVGLLIGGFFGTLDNPSQRTLSFLKGIGLNDLESIKIMVDNIYYENIRIPFNYIAGQFSSPKKMYIDIGFIDYGKLAKQRDEALRNGILITTENDWVPAIITYGKDKVDVKLRLKGDWTDHLAGKKWSFRIKVKGNNNLDGMSVFSIQNPKTRVYLSEYLYLEALKREGVLAPRYQFINVFINGDNKGVYALEEHFETQLIERNNQREGVFIKFNEDEYRSFQAQELQASGSSVLTRDFYSVSDIDTFDTDPVLDDPVKKEQFTRARNLLESFRIGKLKTHEVFDTDKLANYYALTTVLGTIHGGGWHNIRFYYNPVTSLLEPIGYDGSARSSTYKSELLTGNHPNCIENTDNSYAVDQPCLVNLTQFNEPVFSDSVFFEKYMAALERMSEKSYLDNLLEELQANLNSNLNILHKDNPFYHFPQEIFYYNQNYLYRLLNPPEALEAHFEKGDIDRKSIQLSIGNKYSLPLEIASVMYNDSVIFLPEKRIVLQPLSSTGLVHTTQIDFKIPDGFQWNDIFARSLKVNYKIFGTLKVQNDSVLPWNSFNQTFAEDDFINEASEIKSIDFLDINSAIKLIQIKKGNWVLNRSIILPQGYRLFGSEGTTIDLIDSAAIFSYASLELIGNKDSPFKVISSDMTGQGLVVLKTDKESLIEYAEFRDLKNPSQSGWEQTGALNFYESPISLKNVKILGAQSEDSINIIRSNFDIEDSIIEDSFSDCVDIDFGTGKIANSFFINCGNDALDFSGSKVEVTNIQMNNIGDKGISAGEKSTIIVTDSYIDKSYICIASKDGSEVTIKGLKAINCKYGFAVYQKKPEFGPAAISALNVDNLSAENKYLVEGGSSLSINGKIILDNAKDVYNTLYPTST